MNILIFGAGGFIGTNLALTLAKKSANHITVVDTKMDFMKEILNKEMKNVKAKTCNFDSCDFEKLTSNQNLIFHLVCTSNPSTSNLNIEKELSINIQITTRLLDACVKNHVGKVVFISSGGTVYGKDVSCPIKEDAPLNPISSYGVQKVVLEKIFYLYNYLYGLDYKIVRLANPYGPYQRPNGQLGVITTFLYKVLNQEIINVYGDGRVVRDFIYIDDAIRAIINISSSGKNKIYNVGSGQGTSIKQILDAVKNIFNKDVQVCYFPKREVDVSTNYLDIHSYEEEFGRIQFVDLYQGMQKTIDYLCSFMEGQSIE